MRAVFPTFVVLAAIALGGSEGAEAPPDWINGHWLDCSNGREVSETWSGGGGLWVGSGITRRAGAAPSFEWMRIGPGSQGGLSFFASPQGAAQTEFPLAERHGANLVFSNPSHDFPQRVLYSRTGETLTGAIEGTINGQARRIAWTYRRGAPGEHCPGFD
jgi:hypothetical protein